MTGLNTQEAAECLAPPTLRQADSHMLTRNHATAQARTSGADKPTHPHAHAHTGSDSHMLRHKQDRHAPTGDRKTEASARTRRHTPTLAPRKTGGSQRHFQPRRHPHTRRHTTRTEMLAAGPLGGASNSVDTKQHVTYLSVEARARRRRRALQLWAAGRPPSLSDRMRCVRAWGAGAQMCAGAFVPVLVRVHFFSRRFWPAHD